MKKSETLSHQIYEYIKSQIQAGAYPDGKLPTENELAQQFFVSRITTKNAMKQLAEEGLIVRIQGKGSFVSQSSSEGLPHFSPPPPKTQKTIALIMGGYTSSFGLDVLNGAIMKAQSRGAHLIVASSNNDQQLETELISSFMNAGVKGIVVQPAHGEMYSRQIIQALYSGYPIVMLDRRMQGIDAPFVGVDNRALSRSAVNHLIQSGHRDIALLALADERSSTILERMEGFMDACVDNHVAVNKDLWLVNLNSAFNQPPELLNVLDTYENYVEQIQQHLLAHPEITAIFGTEYRVSKAAWEALRRLGRKTPEDVSLVSFDMDSSYVGSHTMSYIKQPQHELGQRAVELLLDAVDHKPLKETNCILEGEWVDGGTVGTHLTE